MEDNYCCNCKQLMEDKELDLEFVRFTETRTPLYKKLYAFFCPKCGKFRQISKERVA